MADSKHPRATFRAHQKNAHEAFKATDARPDFSKALVVLDTNVLLAPYRASAGALRQIMKVYEQLAKEGRLLVPAEAAREFARNRPGRLAELHKLVTDAASANLPGRKSLPPAVQDLPKLEEAERHWRAAQTAIRAYSKSLGEVAAQIATWHHRDPVLDMYAGVFTADVVHECEVDGAEFDKIRTTRFSARQPPGYRDKDKPDGGRGDLLIWFTLLEAAKRQNRDAVFVTEEEKDDWFHSEGNFMMPRVELAAEFAAETDGRRYFAMKLAGLLAAMGADEDIVEEVRAAEERGNLLEPPVEDGSRLGLLAAIAETAVKTHMVVTHGCSIREVDGFREVNMPMGKTAVLNVRVLSPSETPPLPLSVELRRLSRRTRQTLLIVVLTSATWATYMARDLDRFSGDMSRTAVVVAHFSGDSIDVLLTRGSPGFAQVMFPTNLRIPVPSASVAR